MARAMWVSNVVLPAALIFPENSVIAHAATYPSTYQFGFSGVSSAIPRAVRKRRLLAARLCALSWAD